MATVVRRYRRVGTSDAALQQRVSSTAAINANFTNVLDVDVNNATTNAVEALDAFMNSIGFPLDAAATAVDVAAHASRHNGAGADAVPNATTAVAGLVSSTDKTKLDTITTGAVPQILVFGFGNITATADTRYIPIGVCDTNATARTTEVSVPMSRAGVLRNLFIYHNSNPGNANTVNYNIVKNGTGTLLQVDLAANSKGPISNLFDTVTIAVGDRISVAAIKGLSISNGVLNIGGSVEFSNS